MFRLFIIFIFCAFSSCIAEENGRKTIIIETKSPTNLIKAIAPSNPLTSFKTAKENAQDEVYYDNQQTFYCGCGFKPTTNSGVIIDPEKCGYKPKRDNNRSKNMEWEHIVPAYELSKNLSCSTDGHHECFKNGKPFKGRKCCTKVDKCFAHAEADLHNLVPAIGEINGDRSNYRFNEIAGEVREYGSCDFEV